MLSHLFTFMLTESRMKIHRSQTISGASRQNSVAAFSQTTEADGDLLKNVKEKKHNNNKQHKMASYSSPTWNKECIFRSLKIDLKRCYLHSFFNLKSSQ